MRSRPTRSAAHLPIRRRVRSWLLAAAAVVAWPPGSAKAAPPCPADAPAPVAATLGPDTAGHTVTAWLDPVDPGAWRAFVELRRLVADEAGSLRVRIHLARSDGRPHPRKDAARAWAMALVPHGRLPAALRIAAREGTERLTVRLGTASGRADLAEALALPPAQHERLATGQCLRTALARNTAELAKHFADNPASIRTPAFEVDGIFFDDTGGLDRLRPQLGQVGLSRPPSIETVSLPLQASFPAMARPDVGGIILGGPTLPHRFVLQPRDADDASLFMVLPLMLRARRALPGRLAVHVVARGGSLGAASLRQRLCAARIIGREVAYLESLAQPPHTRERPSADVVALVAALDKVPEEACADEVDPAQRDLPDGHWLDGLPRARGELDNLATTLEALQRLRRPLTPYLRGRPATR